MNTYILIHGSWHGAWCWYKIKPRLEKSGHKVFVPDLPAHGTDWRLFRGRVTLAKMVKSITNIIDALEEKVIIVVHSRNGIVASSVAELRPQKVEKLIYLASFMLRNGERAVDYFINDKHSLLLGNVVVNRLQITDMIKSHIYREALYADCTDDDVALAYALLTPEPSLPALKRLKLTEKNYGSVPRYYIELLQDKAVSLNLQRKLLEQTPCKKVLSIDASHSAYFSKPDELTETILNASRDQ